MIVDVGADEVLASEAGCLTGKNMDGTPWANPAGGEYCAGILARVNRTRHRPDRALPPGDRAVGQLPAGRELHQPDLDQGTALRRRPEPGTPRPRPAQQAARKPGLAAWQLERECLCRPHRLGAGRALPLGYRPPGQPRRLPAVRRWLRAQ
ncbi:hypothetical protein G6F24_015602 [Rhizopus arrhizus]|nr:hypothetical protein G6F24_015602 [Rhizopus arrhizus]